jgi:hypothetical protein
VLKRAWLAAVAGIVLVLACGTEPPPVRVSGRTLIVDNRSGQEWRDVTVTVNGYYRAGARTLAAGGTLNAGLSSLTTGFGQRFDPQRETVRTVEVRATDSVGQPVRLDWPERK